MKGRDKRKRSKMKPKKPTKDQIKRIAQKLTDWSNDVSDTNCGKE